MSKRQRRKNIRKKSETRSLSLYVVFSITMILIYTVVSQVLFYVTGGMENATLTTSFFGVFGGEILLCALIKIFKLRKGGNDDELVG